MLIYAISSENAKFRIPCLLSLLSALLCFPEAVYSNEEHICCPRTQLLDTQGKVLWQVAVPRCVGFSATVYNTSPLL